MMSKTAAATLALFAVPLAAQTAQTQPQSTQAPQQGRAVLENMLGAIFGTSQAADRTLEGGWNQGQRPFAQRRATVEAEIADGVAEGRISRVQADAMRDDYDDIVDTEERYAADGTLTAEERRDLRTRYRALSDQVGTRTAGTVQAQPADLRLAAQERDFETRVATALRDRRITQAEAGRLRADYRLLVQAEAGYARGGVDTRERADLDARFARLEDRLDGLGFGADRNPQRWAALEARIARGERAGTLTRADATMLRVQIADLQRLDTAYGVNGLNTDERSYLTRRYGEISSVVQARS
jgi:hypothetical protein